MTLKEQTLAHYKRMIQWAEKKDPYIPPNSIQMLVEINENWFSESCPLCTSVTDDSCDGCPLAEYGYEHCERTPWQKLEKAKTWKEWLDGAREEITFIESLEF